ncbi:MAG: hypothetical protein OXL68_02955, partial [Paracoccaceae bacterium]|nr:hypothetical protein [Paracoccaceae bacterium]
SKTAQNHTEFRVSEKPTTASKSRCGLRKEKLSSQANSDFLLSFGLWAHHGRVVFMRPIIPP